MKGKNLLFFLLILNFENIISFGLKDADAHLLIFYVQEQDKTEKEVLNEENYMKELMYQDYYSTFNLGLPRQNIKFYYEMGNYGSIISEEFYFPKRSTTYKLIDPNNHLSQELLELDKNKQLENFIFSLKPKNANKNLSNINIIGLNFDKKNNNDSLSFIGKLKEKKYIHSKIFTFLSKDDSFSESRFFDGQVLIGCYPHDISPYFDIDGLTFISVNDNWGIKFDSVKYNNDTLDDKLVELNINLKVTIAPESLRKKLISGFLKEFLDNKKCKETSFVDSKNGEEYIFYSFDNTVFFNEIPELKFFSKDLNDTFILSFADMFIRYRERYYLKILFKKNNGNKWVFGQNFLTKYKFVFDMEKRRIGFYKLNKQQYQPIILVVSLVVFIIILGLVLLRGRMILKNESDIYGKMARTTPIRPEYNKIPENEKNNTKKESKGDKDDKDEGKKIKKE